ncbi:ribosomal protein L27 [Patellaria atrata CBS 101060]|uniref:Large ribosomal subunit protein bL27m n=1 Tax=Patellaria atrata CBS 101060 TaxID=1346257 RepID=A0A9P4SE92_9PEZI|nr:ribosomal protein L27 [Patellaria atrata CBS 101060]
MLLPRIRAPIQRAARAASKLLKPDTTPLEALRYFNPSTASASLTFSRNASHQAQGRANGVKQGAGKRLGAKKTGEQYVVPGNIIFRQRGTHWFPGTNCAMGRDHTIYATQPGFVKYYRDPRLHSKRQYIGVVFKRDEVLPAPPHAARKRRLGMIASPIQEPAKDALSEWEDKVDDAAAGKGKKRIEQGGVTKLALRPGYMYREANWEIGRTAEKAGIVAKKFVPGDRFLAWRKSNARKAKNLERRALSKKKR